jgi:hypothetical protein
MNNAAVPVGLLTSTAPPDEHSVLRHSKQVLYSLEAISVDLSTPPPDGLDSR